MSMTIQAPSSIAYEEIISPSEIMQKIPFNLEHQRNIKKTRDTIKEILSGQDSRLLMVVGPCSIHNPTAALTYGSLLRALSENVHDKIYCVMRTYFEKSRTITGWKGMLLDPDLDESYDLVKGIHQTRSLLVDLTEMQIPCCSELLELTTHHYYIDFLSWVCIGARTCTSPPHRQMASALDFCCGFKNTTDGDLRKPLQAILAAQSPQTFLGLSSHGRLARISTPGNPYCHLVLRGSEKGGNYAQHQIQEAISKCHQAKIPPQLIVDCSHGNSQKNPYKQIEVFKNVIEQIRKGNHAIRGLMLESNLQSGSQKKSFTNERSITDPCLDWSSTEALITWAYTQLD